MTILQQTHADLLANQQELFDLCHAKRCMDARLIPDNPLVPRFIALRRMLERVQGFELRVHEAANDAGLAGAA